MAADDAFEVAPQLTSSTHKILSLPLCDVLLNDDSTWPWVILVPRVKDAVEIHDLGDEDQAQLMREVSQCSRGIKRHFKGVNKMNVGAIGCVCRQLHVHVLGRFENDVVWPRPVWGATNPKPYGDKATEAVDFMKRAIKCERV